MIAHEPTENSKQLVTEFVRYGIAQEHIARRLDISVDSLAKHYRFELDNGLANSIQEVANALWSKAVNDKDLTAMIFYLKTRGKWREKDKEDEKKSDSVIEFLLSELKAKKG